MRSKEMPNALCLHFLNTDHQFFVLFQISKWVEDETTFCLMNLILLFSAGESRKQLKDPLKVEAYQLYFTQLLHRYLCSRYNKTRARSKLAEGIRLVSHCRELHQLAALRCSMTRKISESQSSTTSSSGSEDNWERKKNHENFFKFFCKEFFMMDKKMYLINAIIF